MFYKGLVFEMAQRVAVITEFGDSVVIYSRFLSKDRQVFGNQRLQLKFDYVLGQGLRFED